MLSHIEKHCRRNVDTSQAVRFGQKLDVICDFVSAVQRSIWTWLVRDLEQTVDLLLVDANAASQFGKP
jgi:hypothetical protein